MKKFILIFIILFSLIGNAQNHFPVQIDDKWGYIDRKGELKIPAQFEKEAKFHNGFALIIQKDAKIRVIDTLGNTVILFTNPNVNRYYTHRFSEGLLAVYVSQKGFGFIDTSGNWVIPPKYHKVLDFSEGVAAVWEDADFHVDEWSGCATAGCHPKWGFIDKLGKYIIQPEYEEVTSFINGIAITSRGELIDKKGNILTEVTHINSLVKYRRVRHDHSIVYKQGRWVPYNQENFEACHILARVEENKKYGFLDFNGEWEISPIYDGGQFFSEGLAGVQLNGNWGYVNCHGQLVIQPQYQFIYFFSEGLGAVQKNGKWGFIDSIGKIVIPFEYDEKGKFEDGLVKVEKDGNMIYLDKSGNIIWKEK